MQLSSLLNRSFTFYADSFEEYQNGRCINRGMCNAQIIALVHYGKVDFSIINSNSLSISTRFSINLGGTDDLLEDRIQYGRLPMNMYSSNSYLPIVCNIFPQNNLLRFAMLSPLRLIEFRGHIELVR